VHLPSIDKSLLCGLQATIAKVAMMGMVTGSLMGAFGGLEPCAVKVARTVLREPGVGNSPGLLGYLNS